MVASNRSGRYCGNRPNLETLEDRVNPSPTGLQFNLSGTPSSPNTVLSRPVTAWSPSAGGLSVVAWNALYAANYHGFVQFINADGTRHANVIPIGNQGKGIGPLSPAVAMDPSGNAVIAWQRGPDIVAARYSPTGVLLNQAIVAATGLNEHDPSVAVSSGGEVVVTYTRDATAANGDIVARRFTPGLLPVAARSSSPDGSFFVANTPANEFHARVARSAGSDGRFSVAYGSGGAVYAVDLNRYAADGSLLGTHVVASGSDVQRASPAEASFGIGNVPALDMDNAGNTVVAWEEKAGTDWNIFARRVTAAGVVGAPLAIITRANWIDTVPAVAVNKSDGDFVVTFQAQAGLSKDSLTSVYVGEFARTGERKGIYNLGGKHLGGNVTPAVSMYGGDDANFVDRYLVTYVGTEMVGEPDPAHNFLGDVVFDRMGKLS
jgi:hypothetical protein